MFSKKRCLQIIFSLFHGFGEIRGGRIQKEGDTRTVGPHDCREEELIPIIILNLNQPGEPYWFQIWDGGEG